MKSGTCSFATPARTRTRSLGHFKVGEKKQSDYVGSCINLAARLQKLGPLHFACSTRGITMPELSERHSDALPRPEFVPRFTKESAQVRGVGAAEKLWVRTRELTSASAAESQAVWS